MYERCVFFALSKVLDLAFSPFAWALLLALVCAWAAWRGQRRRAWIAGALAFFVAYVPSTTLCARALCRHTERFDARRAPSGAKYDAVVVLGGFALRGPTGDLELADAADRLLRASELLASGRAERVIIAAGGESPSTHEVEADVIAALLARMGVARSRMLLDRESRNTRENALHTAAIVKRASVRSLVLVTSAAHMQRAIDCFRAVGLSPDAVATDHQTPRYEGLFDDLAPRTARLMLSERMLRELAGRLIYRLRGFSRPSS